MAETVIQEPPVVAPILDNAKTNADLAAKMAGQDIMGQSTAADPAGDAGDALDALAKQHEEAAKKAAEDAAAAAAEDEAAKAALAKTNAEQTPEEKVAAESAAKAAAEAAARPDPAAERAKNLFKDAPSLPPGAAPKSSEAFATVKIMAAKEIQRIEEAWEKTKAELKAIKDASANPSTEQLEKEKELSELREWRAKVDVDFDPKFKEFDKGIESARDFIYAQLKRSPVVTDEIIEQIKKFGGPDKTNLSKLFESMADPTIQRVIESKVSDILHTRYNKEQAIQVAKQNFQDYAKTRQDELNQSVTGHVNSTKAALDQMLPNLKWMETRELKPDLTAEARAAAEDHNKFVTELRGQLDAALVDDSPAMRAILITGMAQLFHTQREKASVDSRLATVTKELESLQAKWDKVKASSTSRLHASGASTTAVSQPKKVDHTTPAGDALDAIAKQVMEERNLKGVGANS